MPRTSSTATQHDEAFAASAPSTPYPRLPSYEEATKTADARRLPSYRQSKSYRYHPYPRCVPALGDGTGIDRLYNTIYDEERVDVVPPPSLPHGPPPTLPLVASPLLAAPAAPAGPVHNMGGPAHHAHGLAQAQPAVVGLDRRVHAPAIAEAILQEFVAGLLRAREAA